MALLQQTMTIPPPKESNFNMSHKHRTNIFIGMCTPVDTVQMVPGDVIDISARVKLITEALANPCFGQMRLQMDHFFVPYRILWDKWPDFIRQGENSELVAPFYYVPLFESSKSPVSSSLLMLSNSVSQFQGSDGKLNYIAESDLPAVDAQQFMNWPWVNGYREQDFGFVSTEDGDNGFSPIVNSKAVPTNNPFNIVKACSLVNYLDLPVGYFKGVDPVRAFSIENGISLFNVLAYNKIWYEWYRNPQEMDYAFYGDRLNVFTGDESLSIDTSSLYSEIFTNQEMEDAIDFVNSSLFSNSYFSGKLEFDQHDKYRKFLFSLKKRCFKHDYLSSVLNAQNYDNSTAVVNVSGNQFTINQWRQALHVDKYQKRTYLGGDKYIDWIRAHWGVIDSDSRLQRPELLSSISSDIIFVDVESQASTEGATLGQLASRGISLNEQPSSVRFRATEHGVYMIIASVVPIVDDLYGVPKMVQKVDTFDFFVPALDNIDFQPVFDTEYSATDDFAQALSDDRWISVYGSAFKSDTDITTIWQNKVLGYFSAKELGQQSPSAVGYLPAWTEYKTCLNRVTGYLSSTAKSFVLARPNPFENRVIGLDYDKYQFIDGTDKFVYVGNGTWIYNYGLMDVNKIATNTVLIPEFTDNYLNNIHISQYVDFRDFAYMWPDQDAKYPFITMQLAFDCVMRRPMSKWSMPL